MADSVADIKKAEAALRSAYDDLDLGKKAKEAWAEIEKIRAGLEGEKAKAADSARKIISDAKKEADFLLSASKAQVESERKKINAEIEALHASASKSANARRSEADKILESAKLDVATILSDVAAKHTEASGLLANAKKKSEDANTMHADAATALSRANQAAQDHEHAKKRYENLRAAMIAALDIKG